LKFFFQMTKNQSFYPSPDEKLASFRLEVGPDDTVASVQMEVLHRLWTRFRDQEKKSESKQKQRDRQLREKVLGSTPGFRERTQRLVDLLMERARELSQRFSQRLSAPALATFEFGVPSARKILTEKVHDLRLADSDTGPGGNENLSFTDVHQRLVADPLFDFLGRLQLTDVEWPLVFPGGQSMEYLHSQLAEKGEDTFTLWLTAGPRTEDPSLNVQKQVGGVENLKRRSRKRRSRKRRSRKRRSRKRRSRKRRSRKRRRRDTSGKRRQKQQ
jgi:hypothetical protein